MHKHQQMDSYLGRDNKEQHPMFTTINVLKPQQHIQSRESTITSY